MKQANRHKSEFLTFLPEVRMLKRVAFKGSVLTGFATACQQPPEEPISVPGLGIPGPFFIGVNKMLDLINVTIFVLICWWLWTRAKNKKRRAALMAKYGNEVIVNRIMNKEFWQGASHEHILDSLGRPADVDENVMKTKTKIIWKYNKTGKNRYGLRITLENGFVTGWDMKG